MRKSRNLRNRMFLGFLIAALIPVLLFATISHMILQSRNDERMEERLAAAEYNTSQCFTLLLDKYDAILQDFCMDARMTEIAVKWKTEGEISAKERQELNRELSNICNRDEGIEGITLQLDNGQIYFYDYQEQSFSQSTWANQFEIPQAGIEKAGIEKAEMEKAEMEGAEIEEAGTETIGSGNRYRGLTVRQGTRGKNLHLFQIVREWNEDYGSGECLGTVVLSLSETFICDMLQSDEGTSVYLLDGDVIVCARDETQVGMSFSEVKEERDNRYTTVSHEESGMTICVELPMKTYYEVSTMQFYTLLIVAVVIICLSVTINFITTQPSINMVTALEEAIGKVENGDFSAQVQIPRNAPTELMRIGNGFNSMVSNTRHLIQENQRTSMEQRNAELSALEAQIDPHFLYNTLDTINWKAIENEQYEISEMIVALADILRYIVKNAAGVTTLNKELAWLEQYTMLQSLKLGKTPGLEIIVSEDVMGCKIHKLLLQPFVENAIKYGFAEKEGDCELLITAKLAGAQLHIMIEDNGCGMPKEVLQRLNDESREYEGHVGVSNVRKRLKLYYGEEAMVYFESVRGEYTRVHLFIPVGEEQSISGGETGRA